MRCRGYVAIRTRYTLVHRHDYGTTVGMTERCRGGSRASNTTLSTLAFVGLAACGGVGFEYVDAGGDAVVQDGGPGDAGPGDAGPGDATSDPISRDVVVAVDAGPTGSISALDLGNRHTCLIRSGVLYCFGQNNESQLGLGDTTNRSMPTRVGDTVDWMRVAILGGHSCGLREDGTVWCWGANEFGQLGLGDTTARSTPTLVMLPADATDVVVGDHHTCALLADNRLACWGRGLEGPHGLEDGFDGPDILVPMIVPGSTSWEQVHAGNGHTLAVGGGALFGVGRNTQAQLGLGPAANGQYRTFTEILAGGPTAMGGGQNDSCAVLPPGELFCWGENGTGELGLGDLSLRDSPTRVGDASDWRLIALNFWTTCGVRGDGVYCSGRGVEGQLGSGAWDDSALFMRTLEVASGGVVDLAMGRNHACVLLTSGELMCTGDNGDGQLGSDGPSRRNTWEPVLLPEE